MSRVLACRVLVTVCVAALGFVVLMVGIIWAVPLPDPDIAHASRVLDIHGRLIRELYVERRTALTLDEIPSTLRLAILTVEDERFYHHFGLDPIALVRATVVNWRSGRIVEGGSTISQQLVKNLYLSHDRTYYRKIMEALLTVKLEMRMDKNTILQLYLNQIYMGHGAYGVEAASQTYFGKSARALDLAESALLAAIIRSPENYSPYNNPERAKLRRNQVLDRMEKKGHITAMSADQARQAPIHLTGLISESAAPYFISYLLT